MPTAIPHRMRICYAEGCHIFEAYTIKDDKLCKIGNRIRTYDATQCPALPEAFANIQAGNVEALLQFARTYGNLGYLSLNFLECGGYFDDEPLAWIWAHLQTVQLCLKLTQYCDEQRAAWELDEILNQYRTPPSPQDPTTDAIRIAVLGQTTVMRLTRKPQDSMYDFARKIRYEIIRRNTKELISRSRGADGNTQSVLDYGSLIEVVYWHLSQMDQKPARQCAWCGSWFIVQHRRQTYCPHPKEPGKESPCAANARQTKRRQTKRESTP